MRFNPRIELLPDPDNGLANLNAFGIFNNALKMDNSRMRLVISLKNEESARLARMANITDNNHDVVIYANENVANESQNFTIDNQSFSF